MARYLSSTQGAKFDAAVFEKASHELHDAFFVKGNDGVLRVPRPPELEKAVSAWVAKFQVAARACFTTLATVSLSCRQVFVNKQGVRFFKADMDTTHKNQLGHIRQDCISDPIGIKASRALVSLSGTFSARCRV